MKADSINLNPFFIKKNIQKFIFFLKLYRFYFST